MLNNLHHLESDLWEAADQVRANSRLTVTEYSIPVLGLIFLRHAKNRFEAFEKEIKASLPTQGGQTRPITREDFKGRRAIYLPETARHGYLVGLPENANIGKFENWRDKETTRSKVQTFIFNFLWDENAGLPIDDYQPGEVKVLSYD